MLLVASTIFCDILKQTDRTFAPSGPAHTAWDTITKCHWCYHMNGTGRKGSQNKTLTTKALHQNLQKGTAIVKDFSSVWLWALGICPPYTTDLRIC